MAKEAIVEEPRNYALAETCACAKKRFAGDKASVQRKNERTSRAAKRFVRLASLSLFLSRNLCFHFFFRARVRPTHTRVYSFVEIRSITEEIMKGWSAMQKSVK